MGPSPELDFSLVIPTYNERENLPELFARLDRILHGRSFEVILVDDDSPDATWAAAVTSSRWVPMTTSVCKRSSGSARRAPSVPRRPWVPTTSSVVKALVNLVMQRRSAA